MDTSLVPIDRQIIGEVSLFVDPGGSNIEFQFPPRITNEANTSSWKEEDLWAIEPLKIHKGSGGKNLTMKWEYIATDPDWSGDKIAGMLRDLKTYFFEFSKERYPVVMLRYGEVIPVETNFRLMSCDITYSEELVMTSGFLYPLRTEVSCKLELATRVNDFKTGEDQLEVDPLGSAEPEWY